VNEISVASARIDTARAVAPRSGCRSFPRSGHDSRSRGETGWGACRGGIREGDQLCPKAQWWRAAQFGL